MPYKELTVDGVLGRVLVVPDTRATKRRKQWRGRWRVLRIDIPGDRIFLCREDTETSIAALAWSVCQQHIAEGRIIVD